MSKKVLVHYDYIINCSDEVEVDDDFDINDEDEYDNIDLPDHIIEIKINGEDWDYEFLGVTSVTEE
jgi:hypothetical protein